jgi:hypothetical protein
MALPKKKIPEPEISEQERPMRIPEKDAEKIILKEAENDNQSPEETTEELKQHFLRDLPHFTAHKGDMRAMDAARRLCKLWRYEDLNIFVLMGDAKERDISAEHILAGDDENNVTFYGAKRSVTNALRARGHKAEKANLSERYIGERADVFVMLDPDVRVTPKLLRHIEPGGFVWCNIVTANALRARGKYRFVGAVRKDGGLAFGGKENDPTFWEKAEVDSDASFEVASGEGAEGVVTYTEAARKVSEAQNKGVRGMTDNIFESYKELMRLAKEQNKEAVAEGETELPLSLTVGRKGSEENGSENVWSTTINTLLPTKLHEHDDKIIAMRKYLS